MRMWQAQRFHLLESKTIILIDEVWFLMQLRKGATFLEAEMAKATLVPLAQANQSPVFLEQAWQHS